MGSHILVLADKAIGLACAINRTIGAIRLSEVREQAVLKTPLSRLVSEEDRGRFRAC